MRRVLFILSVIFIIHSFAAALTNSITNNRIAVLDITSRVKEESIDTTLFSDTLQSELLHQKTFQIVERSYLSKILDEQKLQLSGITESDAAKVGRLAQADKIIVGSLSRFDNKYYLVIKVIDTANGLIDVIEDTSDSDLKGILNNIPGIARNIAMKFNGANDGKAVESSIPETANQSWSSQPNEKGGRFTPIQISFVESIQLFSSDYSVYGASFGLITSYNYRVYGYQACFITRAASLVGLQNGFLNRVNERMVGMQDGFINNSYGKIVGVQAGFINSADDMTGLQMGFFNYAEHLHGVQLGFLNSVKYNWLPFMMGINIGF